MWRTTWRFSQRGSERTHWRASNARRPQCGEQRGAFSLRGTSPVFASFAALLASLRPTNLRNLLLPLRPPPRKLRLSLLQIKQLIQNRHVLIRPQAIQHIIVQKIDAITTNTRTHGAVNSSSGRSTPRISLRHIALRIPSLYVCQAPPPTLLQRLPLHPLQPFDTLLSQRSKLDPPQLPPQRLPNNPQAAQILHSPIHPPNNPINNLLRPIRVLQRAQTLTNVRVTRANTRQERRPAVAAQRILQQPGQLTLSIRDMLRTRALGASQRVNYVPEREQSNVNLGHAHGVRGGAYTCVPYTCVNKGVNGAPCTRVNKGARKALARGRYSVRATQSAKVAAPERARQHYLRASSAFRGRERPRARITPGSDRAIRSLVRALQCALFNCCLYPSFAFALT